MSASGQLRESIGIFLGLRAVSALGFCERGAKAVWHHLPFRYGVFIHLFEPVSVGYGHHNWRLFHVCLLIKVSVR